MEFTPINYIDESWVGSLSINSWDSEIDLLSVILAEDVNVVLESDEDTSEGWVRWNVVAEIGQDYQRRLKVAEQRNKAWATLSEKSGLDPNLVNINHKRIYISWVWWFDLDDMEWMYTLDQAKDISNRPWPKVWFGFEIFLWKFNDIQDAHAFLKNIMNMDTSALGTYNFYASSNDSLALIIFGKGIQRTWSSMNESGKFSIRLSKFA